MGRNSGLRWASVFLSHSSQDKDLVKAVATELTQRGIIPWLDVNELRPSQDLSYHLERAIQRQAGFVVFLSETSFASDWVEDELATALDVEKRKGKEIIIPIYLGDALKLVQLHSLLRSRWIHADGDRVKKLGILANSQSDGFNPAEIAEQVAFKIYDLLNFKKEREVVLYIDQRGAVTRTGLPDKLPEVLNDLDCPGLFFRPDLGDRHQYDVLTGFDWEIIAAKMQWALEKSLGTPTWPDPKKIRIAGHSQLALPFFIGHYFNRSTSADLFCYHHSGTIFTNKDQNRDVPLQGGNAQCYSNHTDIAPLPTNFEGQTLALFLMRDYLLPDALSHWKSNNDDIPGIWVDHGKFETSEDVKAYISDVVALLQQMKQQHNVRVIRLYTSLPFNVLPLLAANLLHVIHKIEFMEFREDLKENYIEKEELYTQLFIKTSYDQNCYNEGKKTKPLSLSTKSTALPDDVLLLDQWDLEKELLKEFQHLSINFGRREKEDILRKVAYTIQTHMFAKSSTNNIDAVILTRSIEDYLHEKLGIEKSQDIARVIVEQLPRSNCINYNREINSYVFVNSTYLYYFCADEIVHQFNARDIAESELINLFDEHGGEKVWREVLCRVCEQIDEKFTGEIVTHLVSRVRFQSESDENISKIFLAMACIKKQRKTKKIEHAVQCLRNYLVDLYTENENTGLFDQSVAEVSSIGKQWPNIGNIENSSLSIPKESMMRSYPFQAWVRFFEVIGDNRLLLTEYVYDEHPRVREGALVTLSMRWPNNRTRLLLTLRAILEEDEYTRKAALQALNKKWPDDNMYQELIQETAQHDNESINSAVLLTLIKKCPDETKTISELLKTQVLKDKNSRSRSMALGALANQLPKEKIQKFIDELLVDNNDGDVFKTAIEIWIEKWPSGTIHKLVKKHVIDGNNEIIRSIALQVLAKNWTDKNTRKLLVCRAKLDEHIKPRGTALEILAEKWSDEITREFIMERAVNDNDEYQST